MQPGVKNINVIIKFCAERQEDILYGLWEFDKKKFWYNYAKSPMSRNIL